MSKRYYVIDLWGRGGEIHFHELTKAGYAMTYNNAWQYEDHWDFDDCCFSFRNRQVNAISRLGCAVAMSRDLCSDLLCKQQDRCRPFTLGIAAKVHWSN